MAGINNLGNNLKLQNLQLSKTAEVDTQKSEGKEVGDAKPSAVWLVGCNNPLGRDVPKENDVFIVNNDGKLVYFRLIEGEYVKISHKDVKDSDYEENRGDIGAPWR